MGNLVLETEEKLKLMMNMLNDMTGSLDVSGGLSVLYRRYLQSHSPGRCSNDVFRRCTSPRCESAIATGLTGTCQRHHRIRSSTLEDLDLVTICC